MASCQLRYQLDQLIDYVLIEMKNNDIEKLINDFINKKDK
jgi:hypothetical protein